MVIETLPLVEVNKEALRVLYKEIGVVNTVRFMNQFMTGFGDYTKEREQLFAGMTMDDILAKMKQKGSKPHE